MDRQVRKWVAEYDIYWKIKKSRYKSYGKMKLQETPGRAWQSIVMDFIIKLPELTDRLMKMKYNSI